MPRGFGRIEAKYYELPADVQNYLGSVPLIIATSNDDTFDMLLAYLSIKVEKGLRRILYAGVIKLRKANRTVALTILTDFYMGRQEFHDLYEILAGRPIATEIIDFGEVARPIRNEVIHGRIATDAEKVLAIKAFLKYIKSLNEQAATDFEFEPFGDLTLFNRGVRADDDATSRQTLGDLGIPLGDEA